MPTQYWPQSPSPVHVFGKHPYGVCGVCVYVYVYVYVYVCVCVYVFISLSMSLSVCVCISVCGVWVHGGSMVLAMRHMHTGCMGVSVEDRVSVGGWRL